MPKNVSLKKKFANLQELLEYKKECYKIEDPSFLELLKLIGETYDIFYKNSRKPLYISVEKAYKKCLEKYPNTGEIETVLFGIAELLHKEGVEGAFTIVVEDGEIDSSKDYSVLHVRGKDMHLRIIVDFSKNLQQMPKEKLEK